MSLREIFRNRETASDPEQASPHEIDVSWNNLGEESRGAEVADTAFGARFVSYRNLDRFEAQTDELNPGLIVWPGGSLAEVRTDRYGLEYKGLYNDAIDRPDLAEVFELAIGQDAALAVVLPTARYVGREADLVNDLNSFLSDVLGGTYGALPKELIFEVGAEYYANFEDGAESAEASYAAIADTMVSEIAVALADPGINTLGADVTIAVQTGRTLEDDQIIRDGMSEFSLQNTDMLIHHRFPHREEGFDNRVEAQEEINAAWETEINAAGGEDPGFFVSAWNVAQLTRQEALADFLDQHPEFTADDVDLEGRTTTAFEQHWQSMLGQYAYGARHPAMILEGFSTYATAGMTHGAVFGSDTLHSGRLSWRDEDGQDWVFAGGEMYEMLRESVVGMVPLEQAATNDSTNEANTYVFEDENKLVIFVTSGAEPLGEVHLNFEGFDTFSAATAISLEAEVPADWMNIFGVPDTANVDETPEGWTYAVGAREPLEVSAANHGLVFELDHPYEVARIVIAKTDVGAEEIASLAEQDGVDVVAFEVPEAKVEESEVTSPLLSRLSGRRGADDDIASGSQEYEEAEDAATEVPRPRWFRGQHLDQTSDETHAAEEFTQSSDDAIDSLILRLRRSSLQDANEAEADMASEDALDI